MKQLIALLFTIIPAFALAQTPSVQEGAMTAVSFTENKVVSLAEAIPADKYDWRPEEGVRSIGEALMHMAAANYFFFLQTGAELPEGIDPMTMESSISGKENVIEALQASFAFAKEQIGAIEDKELADKVEMPFPGEFNKQSVIMICMNHMAEHMGQMIAYARINGVTPPWSLAQDGGE